MIAGYIRTSPNEQSCEIQRGALQAVACDAIYEDIGVRIASRHRPGLNLLLSRLHTGDTVIVWKLDRLGYSLAHVIRVVQGLHRQGIRFRSLNENIDTASSNRVIVLNILRSLAELDRSIIAEKTRAGMVAVRKDGIRVGRRAVLTPAQIDDIKSMIDSGIGPSSVARRFKIARSTLYRAIRKSRLS